MDVDETFKFEEPGETGSRNEDWEKTDLTGNSSIILGFGFVESLSE